MTASFREFAAISNPPEAWKDAHNKIGEGCNQFADSLDGLCNSAEKMLDGEMAAEEYNNTITGESFEKLIYPEFKGYHGNLYWATLQSDKAPFTIYSETDGLYFRVFTPEEPIHRRDGENSMHSFPEGDLSFLYDIPAIRSFKSIAEHGPKSQPSSIRIKSGDDGLRMKLWFDFRH